MVEYPEYIEIDNKKYKINTSYKIAIKCNQISMNKNIGDFERTFAIIYLLFGDEALDDATKDGNKFQRLVELALKYLSCGKQLEKNDEIPDMDFVEDMDYIEASFMSDYHIDLEKEDMHWWKFSKLINGLSYSELGNCCVLNRIRNLRNFDLSQIKDAKEKAKIQKAKEQVALNSYKKENFITKEQEESMKKLNEILGL